MDMLLSAQESWGLQEHRPEIAPLVAVAKRQQPKAEEVRPRGAQAPPAA